jgi:hypothetical protein
MSVAGVPAVVQDFYLFFIFLILFCPSDNFRRDIFLDLRNIVDAPWFVRNSDLHRDLEVDDVGREIQRFGRNMKKGSISTKTLRPYSYWTTRA